MESKRIVSAVCYFSLFFAPFLVPLVIYFIAPDRYTKEHAKRAFLSHLAPLIVIPAAVAAFISNPSESVVILALLAGGVLSLGVLVYNVVWGIKVLLR